MPESDHFRRTGRTTQLLKLSPPDAIFICAPRADMLTQRMAGQCRRADLRVITSSGASVPWIESQGLVYIVVDHDAPLTIEQRIAINSVNTRFEKQGALRRQDS